MAVDLSAEILDGGRLKVNRCFIVQGTTMALAMVVGRKPFENRTKRWSAGWYFLHAGAKKLSGELKQLVDATWLDAPNEDTLPRQSRLRFGQT